VAASPAPDTHDDVRAALSPTVEYALRRPEELERPSELTYFVSLAVMQVGGEEARAWSLRVLRPLAERPRPTDPREAALAAMCLSSYYRYTPALGV